MPCQIQVLSSDLLVCREKNKTTHHEQPQKVTTVTANFNLSNNKRLYKYSIPIERKPHGYNQVTTKQKVKYIFIEMNRKRKAERKKNHLQ